MAVPIDPVEDDRAERILSDPDKYFTEERERVRAEVIEEMRRDGRAIASSGGGTQLHRVIDLVNSGATPERIKEWCENQISKRAAVSGEAEKP